MERVWIESVRDESGRIGMPGVCLCLICVLLEETQAYYRKCADIFQINNGSLYTSELGHELD